MIYSNFPNSVNIFWHLQLQGMSGSSSANIKSTDDILAYLNEIKDAFKDEVETFDDFIWVMRDYKEKRFDLFIILIENYLNFYLYLTCFFPCDVFCRIDVEAVGSRVKKLFKEHEELLLKFNDYLPEEYKVSLE
jgi:paired amphipathic helix protein Sin3a